MSRFYERAMLCALFLMFAAPAYAATEVDLSGLWTTILEFVAAGVGAIISALVGWVLVLIKTKVGVSIDDSMRASFQTAIDNSIGYLIQKGVAVLPGKVTIENQLLGEAVQYVIKAAPDAVKHFGLTPAAIAEKIEAKLGNAGGA